MTHQFSPATKQFSPATQAVVNAFMRDSYGRFSTYSQHRLSNAIYAIADQVVPEIVNAVGDEHDEARQDQWLRIRQRILAIAADLEVNG